MDFVVQNDNEKFEERALKDFYDFKSVIGIILEKDDQFPSKFCSFNTLENHNW
jgi:hypothetical protein